MALQRWQQARDSSISFCGPCVAGVSFECSTAEERCNLSCPLCSGACGGPSLFAILAEGEKGVEKVEYGEVLVVYLSYVTELSLCANGFQQQVIREDMLMGAFMNVPGIAGHCGSTVMTSSLRMHRPHFAIWCYSAQYCCTACSGFCCGLSQCLDTFAIQSQDTIIIFWHLPPMTLVVRL